MRILFFIHSLRRAGAERVLLEIASNLKKKGHAVEVVSWLNIDEYNEAKYCSVNRRFLVQKNEYRWPWSIPRAAKRLRYIAKKFLPDVIEIHTPNVTWALAWANLKIPCIHVLHGYSGISGKKNIKYLITRFFSRIAQDRIKAKFIVVAPPIAEAGSKYFKVPLSMFTCVPNGIDLLKFKSRSVFTASIPTILMVGTLSTNKGQQWGIKALKEMVSSMPEIRLNIVGEGTYRSELENLVEDSGVQNYVRFLGQRNDVPELMADAQVVWHLSESEGLPIVVLEGMAAGLPVIGFDVRGTRDAVVDGETGYLVSYGDFPAVAKKTMVIFSDSTLCKKLATSARSRAEKYFSLPAMIDGHERVLREVVTNK